MLVTSLGNVRSREQNIIFVRLQFSRPSLSHNPSLSLEVNDHKACPEVISRLRLIGDIAHVTLAARSKFNN